MSDNSSFLRLLKPCDEAVNWMTDNLSHVGLSIMRTFDLQVARHANMDCPCPHHGTDSCDCQMVVLLVYLGKGEPVTLIAHGYNNQTWFSIVDTPQQRADPRIESTIRLVMAMPLILSP